MKIVYLVALTISEILVAKPLSLILTRVAPFSGSEVYDLTCSDKSNHCTLIKKRNGFESGKISMTRAKADAIVLGFESNLKKAHRSSLPGGSPLLKWQLKLGDDERSGQIAYEEVANKQEDPTMMSSLVSLETHFTALLIK